MIVVDGEFSGLDPNKHAILSLGAIDMNDPSREFYGECQIPDWAVAHPIAMQVNGFTDEQIRDINKPTLGELARDFIVWAEQAEDRTLAGQNVWNDWAMLNAAFQRNEIDWDLGHRILDLHSVVYAHLMSRGETIPTDKNMSAVNSEFICSYVGLPKEAEPHIALTGAKWEAEAFSRLFYGKNLLPEFEQHPIPEYLANKLDTPSSELL